MKLLKLLAYNVKTNSLICYVNQVGYGSWGLTSTCFVMHTLSQVDKSLNTHYSLSCCTYYFLYLEGPLISTPCWTRWTLSHPSMSPCLWYPRWLQAELVTLSSGFHAMYPTVLSLWVCAASHLPLLQVPRSQSTVSPVPGHLVSTWYRMNEQRAHYMWLPVTRFSTYWSARQSPTL